MSEVSSKTVLCVDHGLFLPLAIKLAESFQRVLYYSPFEKGFPILNDCVLGDGYENVERVDDIWENLKDVDLFVFPDLQHSGLQLHLESLGKRVWGSREGDDLELRRSFLKKTQEKLGLEVPDYKTITGIANLRTYLKAYEDQFVKISRYRGVMETFHHLTYEQSQPILDHLAVMFGPLQNEVPFLVEGPIKTDIEVGYDGWCIDGEWPDTGLQGVEAKDKALIASVQEYKDMPEEVTSINEALSPVLKKYRYRNFLSTEIRVADKPFLIDITTRAPSPGIEIHMELWRNLPEIIWHGANGEMIEPKATAQFGVECMIDHTGNEDRWRVLEIPKEAEPWVKLYSACKHNDLHCIPPFPHSHDTIGAVVGIGDTVEDAIAHLKSTVELLKDQPVSIHVDALYDILKDIHSAEKKGIEFSDQAVPEPEVALQ